MVDRRTDTLSCKRSRLPTPSREGARDPAWTMKLAPVNVQLQRRMGQAQGKIDLSSLVGQEVDIQLRPSHLRHVNHKPDAPGVPSSYNYELGWGYQIFSPSPESSTAPTQKLCAALRPRALSAPP